ncbi:RNA polymerase sigma factor [Motilibacter aurantiacus]|uniref:RNA polymerase sigma factor n=1 Tax=Motilibacter aurantiacus TaxID=2714955 RepID=UPI00140B6401|nr:sigma-70 family RNA polymerase sigma factor [Motilibacter aurantiacus]
MATGAAGWRGRASRRRPAGAQDAAWLEALFLANGDAVRSYVMYRCGDADLAEDVVSEVFLIAWRDRAAVPEPAVPYLLGVARRVLAGQRRATQRRDRLTARIADGLDGASTALEDGDFESLELREALSRLPDHDREALILVGWCELSNVEAAEALGCSQVTFAVRLHRARRRLRAQLDRADRPGEPSVRAAAS